MKNKFMVSNLVLNQVCKELESRVAKDRLQDLRDTTLGLAREFDNELQGFGNCEALINRIYNNPSKYPRCDIKRATKILTVQMELFKKGT